MVAAAFVVVACSSPSFDDACVTSDECVVVDDDVGQCTAHYRAIAKTDLRWFEADLWRRRPGHPSYEQCMKPSSEQVTSGAACVDRRCVLMPLFTGEWLLAAHTDLENGNFASCIMHLGRVPPHAERKVKLILDIAWTTAQCRLGLGERDAARDALELFSDNCSATDPRFEVAKGQRRALERGELPAAVQR